MPEAGLMVAALEAGSPAERAGLLVGDVLLGMDGRTPGDVESLLDDIAGAREAIRLRLMRGGKISVVDVDLKAPGAPRDTDAGVRRGPGAGNPGGLRSMLANAEGTDVRVVGEPPLPRIPRSSPRPMSSCWLTRNCSKRPLSPWRRTARRRSS